MLIELSPKEETSPFPRATQSLNNDIASVEKGSQIKRYCEGLYAKQSGANNSIQEHLIKSNSQGLLIDIAAIIEIDGRQEHLKVDLYLPSTQVSVPRVK